MKRRGLGLIELVLAFAVFVVAALFVFTVFGGSSRHAVQSRSRKLAIMTAQNLLEEAKGHEFGTPAPESWPLDQEKPVKYRFVVYGRESMAEFRAKIELENRSLIGESEEDFDRVTVTIRWDAGLSGDEAEMKAQEKLRQVQATLLIARPDSFAVPAP